MIATQREQRTQYPGLQESIRKLLHGKPNEVFDVSRILKSFTGKPPNSIHYHLMRLKEKGLAENVKRGFWRASIARDGSGAIDIEKVRLAVAEMPKRIIDGGPAGFYNQALTAVPDPVPVSLRR